MAIHVKVGGAWKEIDAPNIKVGGAYKTPDKVHIKVNGAWEEVWAPASGLTVTMRANGANHTRLGFPVWAGVEFNLSGTEYEYLPAGAASSPIDWLLSGTAAQVWVMWTRTGGTLSDWNSLGAGQNNVRLNLATTRQFRIWDNSGIGGTKTLTGYFRMYDAASGGNLLFTSADVQWAVWFEPDVCPKCCFTPWTLITMASGSQMPISDVREGDLIRVENGIETVKGIIVRELTAMYLIEFTDGRNIEASEDHPFFVEGKGFASISPDPRVSYKDMGVPERLLIGDMVTDVEGQSNQITSMSRIDYPGAVYTLENSKFFANGMLVY